MSDSSTAHIKFFRESVKRFSKEEALHYLEGAYTFQFSTEMEQTWERFFTMMLMWQILRKFLTFLTERPIIGPSFDSVFCCKIAEFRALVWNTSG